MGTYTAGTPVTVTATVKNDQGVNVPDALSWASDQGTVNPNPNGVDADGNVVMTATLVNAPVGTATVTATTSNGLPSTDAIVFTDPAAAVPASISLTDSAAA